METTYKTEQELVNELIPLIHTELDFCNAADTPKVCQMVSEPEGRQKVVDMVLQRVALSAMSVADAILDIEREFNPNRAE